jgi:hypothetical protein
MPILSCLVQEGTAFIVASFATKVGRTVLGSSILRPEI